MAFDLESRIRSTGMKLYRLIEADVPSAFRKEYWLGKMLDWCMRDEAFKVEAFRFIDVFPSLKRPESVARHVKEYFAGHGSKLPGLLHWGARFLPGGALGGRLIAGSMSKNVADVARNFILGTTPSEAVPVLGRLRSEGFAFSVDLLGEAVVSEKEADEYLDRYLDILTILKEAEGQWAPFASGGTDLDWGATPRINVSIKASAMYSQMDARSFGYCVARAGERLRPIFSKAMDLGAFVTLDMEHSGLKDLTLALYKSLMEEKPFRDYPHTGIAIQAYRRDSGEDLDSLIRWAKKPLRRLTVRLVKGAYWDVEGIWARQKNWPIPVFTNKHETDANFERLAGAVMERRDCLRLACASHNIRSIARVMEASRDFGLEENGVEYQVLYGMAEPVRNALLKAGLPLRLYAPIGEMIPGMAYLVRRLMENTSNESFLRRSFAGGVPKEELLRNPEDLMLEDQDIVFEEQDLMSGDDGGAGSFENEPPLDWTVRENRERFEKALVKMRRSFPLRVPLFIGGAGIAAAKEIRSTNPNDTKEVVGIIASAGVPEALAAIRAAREAFPEWRDTPAAMRAEYLFRAAGEARRMRLELAALQVFEVGKSWSDADGDVCEAIDFLEYYAREAIRLGTPRRMGNAPGETSVLFYEPRGVGAVIAPWNFPLAISMGMVSAAIAAGNTVVYKPSSQSAATGSMIQKIFEAVMLPPGVLNTLPGAGSEIGDALAIDPEVDFIAFTGSREVGLRIIELAAGTPEGARGIKSVVAELGGKNAIIVDSDADLDEAVLHILHSAFDYQGQKCSACSRVIVLEENYATLVGRLKEAAESISLGPSEDPKNFMGAVIDASAVERILRYIEIGKEEGTLLLERGPEAEGGNFVPLAIFEDIRPEHRLAQDEIFGPVLSVMKARDFGEALRIADNTRYALTGAVFSRSPGNIERARREFRVGNLYINRGCTGAIVGRHPFGGFRMSGVGSKAGGPDYLLQFMVPRNVVENTIRRGFAPAGD